MYQITETIISFDQYFGQNSLKLLTQFVKYFNNLLLQFIQFIQFIN